MIPYPLANFKKTTTLIGVGTRMEELTIPDWCTFVSIMLAGSGGNGGSGRSGAAGTSRGGGGGGSSAELITAILPVIPGFIKNLYFYLPTSNDSGNAYVAVRPDASQSYRLLEAAKGGSGATSTGSTGGAGGTGTAAAQSGMYQHLRVHNSVSGSVGAAGGAANVNGFTATGGNRILSHGPGGAGITSTVRDGGSFNGWVGFPSVIGGVSSGPGNNGFYNFDSTPNMYTLAGSGGSSINSGTGGRGGNGAPGSGAGGGAAGSTGGAGGTGGPSFAIVMMG